MLTHLLLEVGEFTEQANHLFLSSNSSKIDKSSLTLFKHLMILTTLCTYGIYTFVFVYPNDDHAFIPANSDEFVDGSDSPSRQFTEQDHAFDVVVFQEVHISPHLSDGRHRHHHDILTLWELVLIEPT